MTPSDSGIKSEASVAIPIREGTLMCAEDASAASPVRRVISMHGEFIPVASPAGRAKMTTVSRGRCAPFWQSRPRERVNSSASILVASADDKNDSASGRTAL